MGGGGGGGGGAHTGVIGGSQLQSNSRPEIETGFVDFKSIDSTFLKKFTFFKPASSKQL